MTATIPLAQPYNEKKITFPGYLSYKYDGVPIRLDVWFSKGEVYFAARTRQSEIVHSAMPAVEAFMSCLMETGIINNGRHTFVFEVTHAVLKDFKDVSGVVRRQARQDSLVLNLFDYVNHDAAAMPFKLRKAVTDHIFQHMSHEAFRPIYQYEIYDAAQFERVQAALFEMDPACEGLVYRYAEAEWAAGSRRHDYMKVLHEPMSDVEVIGFEEAVNAKTGEGKGMVGGIRIRWKDGTEHGVGPGKLTHAERVKLWSDYKYDCTHEPEGYTPRIAQIKHKADPTYAGPRQGTFQCWRPEKKEPSYG